MQIQQAMFQPKSIFSVLLAALFFVSCKKDRDVAADTTPPVSATDKLKDSALLFTKDIYLWYSQIPSTFSAQSFTSLDKMMTAVRQYSTETGFSGPVDRWSFAVDQSEWNNVSSGVSGDLGIDIFFRSENDLRIKSVEKDSPAGRLGIKRGWRITKINGNANITTGNTEFIIGAVYNSSNASFSFQKPDGTAVDLSINAGAYQSQPILFDSIYSTVAGKAGYMVFSSFLGDTTDIYNSFQRVFNGFAHAGVKDVIIDLRYNGGGYVSVQEKLANYLIAAAHNGSVMMKQQFNDKYSTYNETTIFKKQGSLNAERLFFIVSKSTASASELLINNLKPYMTTVLAGPSKTYGKPVGYFPIPVGKSYIFPISFRTTNKSGEGSYFDGIAVNKVVADGLDKDWGDVSESAFASILGYINNNGVFRTQQPGTFTIATETGEVGAGNEKLDRTNFKGIVDTRGIKK